MTAQARAKTAAESLIEAAPVTTGAKYSHIVWDWNGTLLDDVDWCMRQVNQMLAKRDLDVFRSLSDYHAVFNFPIRDYYQQAGFDFDKEPFEDLTIEYMDLYHADDTGNCSLHPGAERTLRQINQWGISQLILSASSQANLQSQVSKFPIKPLFDDILGISNEYASGKIDIGMSYFKNRQIDQALMVGDTVHDFEVASALNIDCLLVANGHHDEERLQACGVPVLSDISQVLDFII